MQDGRLFFKRILGFHNCHIFNCTGSTQVKYPGNEKVCLFEARSIPAKQESLCPVKRDLHAKTPAAELGEVGGPPQHPGRETCSKHRPLSHTDFRYIQATVTRIPPLHTGHCHT